MERADRSRRADPPARHAALAAAAALLAALLAGLGARAQSPPDHPPAVGIRFPSGGQDWPDPAGPGGPEASRGGTAAPSPAPEAVEAILLLVTRSGGGLQLSWSGQAGEVSVTTSSDVTFQRYVTTLAEGVSGSSLPAAMPLLPLQFYDVNDGTTAGAADRGMGYTPRALPRITGVQAEDPWWCRPVTVTADNLDPIPSANRLEFNFQSIPADSVDPPEGRPTSATFTIPPDARSTLLTLNVNGRSSGLQGAPWLGLRHPSPFSVGWVHAVAHAPATGHIWVADDAGIWDVDLFRCDPPAPVLVAAEGPCTLSRVMDDGKLLYIRWETGDPSNPDVMSIDTNATNPVPALWAKTTSAGFNRPLRVRGIAAKPDGSAAFLADEQGGCIVRVPAGAGGGVRITDDWGGQTCWYSIGIDAAPDGTVLHGCMGRIYQIPPAGGTTQTLLDTGFAVFSIEVDRDASPPFYPVNHYVYDNSPNCEAWDPSTKVGGRVIARSETTTPWYLYLWPDTVYEIGPPAAQRVVLRNPAQDGLTFPYPASTQVADRVIAMTARGFPGVPVYLRVADPPDAAPYAPPPAAPEYHRDDNKAPDDGTWGLLTNINGTPAKCLSVTPAQLNAPVTFLLKVPERYAGDNFRVEASKHPWGAAPDCAADNRATYMSGLYTSWKRVWVERDKMFRRGGVLYSDANWAESTITLYKAPDDTRMDNLQVGDMVAIFDAQTPYEGTHDEAFVEAINEMAGTPIPPAPHQVEVSLVTARGGSIPYFMGQPYAASPVGTGYYPDFSLGQCAGAGVVNSNDGQITDTSDNQINAQGSAFYDADMRDIQQPFDDGFVEFIAPRSGMGAVPYIHESARFYNGSIPGSDPPLPDIDAANDRTNFESLWGTHAFAPNRIYMLGVTGKSVTDYGVPVTAGISDEGNHYAYVYINSLETLGQLQGNTPAEIVQFEQSDTLHECGHNFRVNTCSDSDNCPTSAKNHHDYRPWWKFTDSGCPNPKPCLMQPLLKSPPDGINRFCKEDLLDGDPNCSSPPSDPRAGAIRTQADPLP